MFDLFYFENGMIDYGGHSFNTAKLIIEKFEKSKFIDKIYLVGNRECKDEIKNNFNFLPFFFKLPKYYFNRNLIYKIIFFLKMIFFTYKPLFLTSKYITKDKKSIFYFNTALAWHIYAICLYLLFNKNKYIIFIITLRLSLYKNGKKGGFYFLNKVIINVLKKLSKKIVFVTDSDILKSEYEKDFQIDLNVLCIPHNPSYLISSFNKISTDRRYCIGILGPSRVHKGSLKSLESLLLIDRDYITISNNIKVIVHAFGELKEAIISIAAEFQNIEIIVRINHLHFNDYYSDLFSCNLVLLNYDSSMYSSNTSGIFLECMCLNIDAIVSKNTWMSHQNKLYNLCNEIDDGNDYNLLNTILKSYNNRYVSENFFIGRCNFSKFHSIENFERQFYNLLN
jgi:hypothetical protein